MHVLAPITATRTRPNFKLFFCGALPLLFEPSLSFAKGLSEIYSSRFRKVL